MCAKLLYVLKVLPPDRRLHKSEGCNLKLGMEIEPRIKTAPAKNTFSIQR